LKHKGDEIDGHVVLRKYEEANIEPSAVETEYIIKENKIKLVALSEEEQKTFDTEHGAHMQNVCDKTVETKRKREVFIKIVGMKFTNGGAIKSFCKKMMIKYKNWAKVNPTDSEFLTELLK